MPGKTYSLVYSCLLPIVGWLFSSLYAPDNGKLEAYNYPPEFDLTNYPPNEAAFELGRFLFYTPQMSKKENTSCATCHLQSTGFAHVDHQLSHGTNGTFSNRNAPALVNLIWKKHFMWDGKVTDLYSFSKHPITNEREMDATFEMIIPRLEILYKCKDKFAKAFGDSTITEERILKALTYFMIELNSFDSKYDKVIKNEAGYSFTTDEKQGLIVFRENCASCHSEPFFTNHDFERNGISIDPVYNDIGRMGISHKKKDYLKFSVPSLRNISVTFPYMHDGRFESLDQVLQHYQTVHTSKEKLLRKIHLTDQDIVFLKAFLLTLTDTNYITNERIGFPPNDI